MSVMAQMLRTPPRYNYIILYMTPRSRQEAWGELGYLCWGSERCSGEARENGQYPTGEGDRRLQRQSLQIAPDCGYRGFSRLDPTAVEGVGPSRPALARVGWGAPSTDHDATWLCIPFLSSLVFGLLNMQAAEFHLWPTRYI